MREKAPGVKKPSLPRWIVSLLGVGALAAIWGLAALGSGGFFVPPPWVTIADAARLLAQGSSWIQILITLLRVFVGFTAGYLFGVSAGIAMGSRSSLDAVLKPLILFFQGMPPLLWAIPLVVVMGIGHLPSILVICLITMPVVAVTVGEGMAGLPRSYREMLQVFAPGLIAKIRELIVPHLKPFLIAALNVGLVLAVKASVTAEYFGANNGIGFQIQAAYQSLQIRRLFSWGMVLILLILLFNYAAPRLKLIAAQTKRLSPHKDHEGHQPEDIRELKAVFSARKSHPMIALEGVSFSYRDAPRLLENVRLTVSHNEIAVISGDSGVGKTTLLKLIASLLRPTEGRIECPPSIGFAFQDDRLLPWRTAATNVALPLIHQGYSRKSSLSFASYLLAEVGLAGEGWKKPEELSGGMKKRVALARCFSRIPDAILLDEPFSGLHREARSHLWDTLRKLLSLHPVPVIVVTHFPEEIASAPGCRLFELRGRPASLARMRRG
jgi:NitT/TauT family transport system ATP-binding protein